MDGFRGKRMADQVLTTNHVVAETISLVRYKGSRESKAAHALATEVGRNPRRDPLREASTTGAPGPAGGLERPRLRLPFSLVSTLRSSIGLPPQAQDIGCLGQGKPRAARVE
jgi:hypothetical protein